MRSSSTVKKKTRLVGHFTSLFIIVSVGEILPVSRKRAVVISQRSRTHTHREREREARDCGDWRRRKKEQLAGDEQKQQRVGDGLTMGCSADQGKTKYTVRISEVMSRYNAFVQYLAGGVSATNVHIQYHT
jgi:hypothetical protein